MGILDRMQGNYLGAGSNLALRCRSSLQQFRLNANPLSPNPGDERLYGYPRIIGLDHTTNQVSGWVFYYLSYSETFRILQGKNRHTVCLRAGKSPSFLWLKGLKANLTDRHFGQCIKQVTGFPKYQVLRNRQCLAVKLNEEVVVILINNSMFKKNRLCVSH